MRRLGTIGIALGLAVAVVAVVRHFGVGREREVPGGILIGHVGAYDLHTRWLLGSLFRSIAADVGAAARPGARVLEVGCGPGHLSVLLARDQGLDVTGLDLDPEMVESARANVAQSGVDGPPEFVVGDAAALPFADSSFDLVVSTLSMHHWSDPGLGLAEIGRVLRPGGRALIWDIRPGVLSFHPPTPDPSTHLHGSGLRLSSAVPWRWPWRLHLLTRMELLPA